MDTRIFDRETLLDLSVNIIPLGIMGFFLVLFAVVSTFEYDPVIVAVQMGLIVFPFIGLAIVTYHSGRVVTRDQQKLESGTMEPVETEEEEAETEVTATSETETDTSE